MKRNEEIGLFTKPLSVINVLLYVKFIEYLICGKLMYYTIKEKFMQS